MTFRRPILLLALTLAPILAPASVPARAGLWRANVLAADGRDPRHEQPRTERPFTAIGLLETLHAVPVMSDDGDVHFEHTQSTAFLVSPCYAVTNYHSVFGDESAPGEAAADYAVTLSVGAGRDGRGFAGHTRAVPVLHGDPGDDREEEDWALLRLDRCLGADPGIGWLDLSPRPLAAVAARTVSIAGYSSAHDRDRLWREDGCHLMARPRDRSLWSSDCAASDGASGSPVFVTEAGRPRIVGVMEGAEDDRPGIQRRYTAEAANIVIDIGAIIRQPTVRAAIGADLHARAAPPAAL